MMVTILALFFGFLGGLGGNSGLNFVDLAAARASFTSYMPQMKDAAPFVKAKNHLDKKKPSKALKIYQGLLDTNPDAAPYIKAAMAEAKIMDKDIPGAIFLLKQVTKTKKRAVGLSAHEKLAEIFLSEGHFVAAVSEYKKLQKRVRSNKKYEFEIKEAKALVGAGEISSAEKKLLRILGRRISPQIKIQAATQLLHMGKIRGSLIKKVADIYYDGGDCPTAANMYKQAYALAKKSKKPWKQRAELLFKWGRSQERSDRWRSAIKTYRELRKIFPKFEPEQVKYHIGLCYQRIGQDKTGEKYLAEILKDSPKSKYADDALYRMATRRDKKEQREEALQLYRRILKEYRRSKWADVAAWKIGFALFEDGKLDEASKAFERALKRNPKSDYASAMGYWRGRILEKLKKEEAVDQYLDVLKHSTSRYYRGRSIQAFGRLGGRMDATGIDAAVAKGNKGDVSGGVKDLITIYDISKGKTSLTALVEARKLLQKIVYWETLAKFTGATVDTAALTKGQKNSKHLDEIVELIDLGAFEEAAAEILVLKARKSRPESRLARARVLAEGGKFRRAIREVEQLVREVGEVPHPAALPDVVIDLLYPRYYETVIRSEAKKYGMDYRFVLAVIREESRFDPGVSSWAGAQGLMQIMPATGRSIAKSLKIKQFKRDMLRDPNVNIAMGVYYLDRMKRQYKGNRYMALSGYNAGPGNTSRWVRQNPSMEEEIWIEKISFNETRNYVKRVLGTYWTYKQLDGEHL